MRPIEKNILNTFYLIRPLSDKIIFDGPVAWSF